MSFEVKTVIDHIGIISKDLSLSGDIFVKLGFATGGRATLDSGIEGETAPPTNMHFVFDNSYIECIKSNEGDYLREYLQSDCALHTIVLSSKDIKNSHKKLAEGGYQVSDIMQAGREANHGELKGQATFDWVKIGNPAVKNTLLGIVEHKTKELIYQKTRFVHDNGAYLLNDIFILEGEGHKDDFINIENLLCDTADSEYTINNASILSKDECLLKFGVAVDEKRSSYVGLSFKVDEIKKIESIATKQNIPFKRCKDGLIFDFALEMNLFLLFTE